MKGILLFLILLLFIPVNEFAQFKEHRQSEKITKLTAQEKNAKLSSKSFYQRKSEWQHIIDSTWGPGLPLVQKQQLFNTFATDLDTKFDGFNSLGLTKVSWDSLKSNFRAKIDSSTSRGKFASIMAQFAMCLRDAHTWAWDTVVTFTPLNPGVPILVLYPFATAEHFGAVLTSLPDSTALVLRTVPNHPLGLQPGDIVLGYEGVEWKNLVTELLDAQLPVFATGVGSISAEINSFIRNVGNNWHLFNTIDVLKHTTGEPVNLSVQPLLNLPSDPMMGNEQLDVPGFSFSYYRGWPWKPTGKLLTYGILPTLNVGYIRLFGEWPSNAADPLFAEAVDSLWDKEGLIIDLRWNSGGWSLFNEAFKRMFSQNILTIEDAYRANSTNYSLVQAGNSDWFQIPGAAGSLFDKPLAILLGPTCVSMGEITAQRLRYHPMVRFFGKPSIASLGDNANLLYHPNWWIRYSKGDMFHASKPGDYLNRQTFPVDESVWFNPNDVALGIDPVLEKALKWISTLAYSYNIVLSQESVSSTADSLLITANVINPENHHFSISALTTNEQGISVDTTYLFAISGDSLWGAYIEVPSSNGKYYISVRTDDVTSGTFRNLPDVTYFIVVISDIENIKGVFPQSFDLKQNYPNPFNPITKIKYSVNAETFIRLNVFDVLGREVATLVNEQQKPGNYEVELNASNLPSGVYFYQLKAGEFVETKKMILMK